MIVSGHKITRGYHQQGFTLIEVIVVLLLIGIVAAVVISRINATNADVVGQTEVLKSHIRYAQSLSMHTDATWGLQFSGATYQLFSITGGARTNRILPNEDDTTVDMPTGMSATGTLAFDKYGKPYTDEALTTRYTGGLLTGITITQDTGFVP